MKNIMTLSFMAMLLMSTIAVTITSVSRRDHSRRSRHVSVKAVATGVIGRSRSHTRGSHHKSKSDSCTKNKDLWMKLDALQAENNKLRHQHKHLVIDIKNMKKDNAARKSQNALWKADADKLSDAEAQVAKLQKAIANKEIVVVDLRARLRVFPEVREENENLKAKLAEVEKVNSELNADINRLNGIISNMNKIVDDLTVIANQADGLRKEIEALTGQVADRDAKISALKDQIREAQSVASGLRSEIATLEAKWNAEKENNKKLNQELDDLNKVIAALNKEINYFTKTVEEKNNQIKHLQKTFSDLSTQIENLNAQIKSLQAEVVERDNLLKLAADLKNQVIALRAKLGWSKSKSSRKSNHSKRVRKGLLVGSDNE